MAAFTTIAAGIGLATTAASTTMSFVQAGQQKEHNVKLKEMQIKLCKKQEKNLK